ncbi:MAG: helix-turn-helix transcriptional regulator [Bdellovibrionota bacterium]
MQGLHDNQKKILEILLHEPEGSTLDELALKLSLSKTAAKEHLLKIEALGYLEHQDSRGSVGHPRRRYLLSSVGREAFPRQYSWLSNVLLELLSEDLGADVVSGIMKKLAKKVSHSMADRFQKKENFADLLAEINAVMNELGYRSSIRQSDLRKGAVLEATNCVYHSVAKDHPELCKFDVHFLEQATGGMSVKLESCIARGGAVCRFCIRKK